MEKKINVAFICTHNSCRSQMAEALAMEMGLEGVAFHSAGPMPADRVDPGAVRALMRLRGVDMSSLRPKATSAIPHPDYAISMGCGVACPWAGRPFDEDWGLEDPTGKGDEAYERAIGEISRRLEGLALRLRRRQLLGL